MRILFALFWYITLIGVSTHFHLYAATAALMVFAYMYFRRQLAR